MYKNRDKQREAGRERARRYRENRQKALLSEGVTDKALPKTIDGVTEAPPPNTPYPKTTRIPTHKCGKDIKCFEDLPFDIQLAILKMSAMSDGKIDQTIKANRTAIAINYQHLFLDRYHSTGIAI